MNKEVIEWLLEKIMEQAKEANELDSKIEFNQGQQFAYHSLLDTIIQQLKIYNIDPKEYGLENIFEINKPEDK